MAINYKNKNMAGFTILEVLIALLIFGFTFTSIMMLILNGDKLNGRRAAISAGTMLAMNQVEKIKELPQSATILGDTSYEEKMNNIPFIVQRTRISPTEINKDSAIGYLEFTVTVKAKSGMYQPLCFHLLQGFQHVK